MKIAIDLQAAQTPSSRHRGIGRASLALVQSMVRNPRGHEFHMVLNEAYGDLHLPLRMSLEQLPADRFHWFHAPTNPEFGGSPLTAMGERMRERAIARVGADLVHVCSLFEGLSDAARTSIGTVPGLQAPLTSATLYDLIPYLRPDPYLVNDDVRAWYYRKLTWLKRAGLLLAISDYARQEAIDALDLDPERVVSISCGADPLFAPVDWQPGEREALMARYQLPRPFVMYTGGDDERKNLKGLIAGWAAVPAELRRQYQLLIVCRLSDMRRVELRQHAVDCGMSAEELSLPGTFVPDEDLRRLYAACELFVFPSLHEGFGLPVLEAMHCGAPVLAADTSSLPEVLGRADALFDPTRTESIRDAIVQTLRDPARLASLRAHGPVQAARFSWDISADRAIDAFEMAHARERFEQTTRVAVPAAPDTRRVAVWVDDGVDATRLSALVEDLRAVRPVELVAAGTVPQDLADRHAVRTPAWVDAHAQRFGRHVHFMTAGDDLDERVARLDAHPGVLVIEGLPREAGADEQTLFEQHGWRAARAIARHGRETAAEQLGSLPLRLHGQHCFLADPALRETLTTRYGASALADWPVLAFTGNAPVLAALDAPVAPTERYRLPHLYVDITMLARHDLRTGIQRVVRSVLAALPEQLPAGWTMSAVCAHGLHGYVHADAQLAEWLALPLPARVREREGQPVQPRAGDQFLGLDWTPQLTIDNRAVLARWRAAGVRTSFVVYDLLPVLASQFFPPEVPAVFGQWLDTIGEADALIAISHAVADELRAWYAAHPPAGGRPAIGAFHLGADLDASLPTQDADPAATAALAALAPGRTALSVGTVEPRKGHADALDAFERLWAEGVAINWVVVGRPGWQTEALAARLRQHPEAGRRLLWLDKASDATLGEAYRRADLLLVPSRGEGFGLPLIEGARLGGLPLLVRDIPVFREVAGAHAAYFATTAGGALPDLARALRDWAGGKPVPSSAPIPAQSWAASTRELLSVVLGGRGLEGR